MMPTIRAASRPSRSPITKVGSTGSSSVLGGRLVRMGILAGVTRRAMKFVPGIPRAPAVRQIR